MRILILNWRDIKNPQSGGAEILTHELARRWVKEGNQVTWFSSSYEGGLAKEITDGIHVIRKGHPDTRYLSNSVHFLAFVEYEKNFKGKFDVVIDEIHGIPFFTPWYVKEKKIALICEVADELWMKMFIPVFGLLGRIVELFYLRFVYRNIPFITISESTKRDLIKHGVDEKHISVLPMGISIPKGVKKFKKDKDPTLIFVGRLCGLKGVEDAILAMQKIVKRHRNAKLWIVGKGNDNYVLHLRKMSEGLNLSSNIIFYKYIDERKKFELMSRAHVLISPSIKEGFGLTIPEAGFVGTPSVVYNSPGLSEVVIDGVTGVVCKKNSPEYLAEGVMTLLNNDQLYRKICVNVKNHSSRYDWKNTVEFFLNRLKGSQKIC